MTLKELMKLIQTPKGKINYMALRARGEIFLKTKDDETVISVYSSGHVIYQKGQRITGFPITDCGTYKYHSSDGSTKVIPAEDFMDVDWRIRVTLEGESRLERNQERDARDYTFASSNGDVIETMEYLKLAREEVFVDTTPSWEDMEIKQEEYEILHEFIRELFPNQRDVIEKHYFEKKSYEEIAQELGKSVKAVRHIEYRARAILKERIKKTFFD